MPPHKYEYHAKKELRKLQQSGSFHPKSIRASQVKKLLEKLGRHGVDANVLFMLKAHLLGCWAPLLHHGKKHIKLISTRKAPLLGLAITEQESGSDVHAIRTIAKRRGSFWILDGKKIFVTNAPCATHLLVLAKSPESSHPRLLHTCFLIPTNLRGISVRRSPPLIGLNNAQIGEVHLRSVKVTDENIVGIPYRGIEVVRTAMLWERSLMFADVPARLKILTQQIESAARKKVRFGSNIFSIAKFQKRMAEVKESIHQIQSSVDAAAAALDGSGNPLRMSLQAKLIGSVQYENASRILLQAGGATAYLHGSKFEENFRDSVLSRMYSGSNELLETLLEALD